VTNLSTPNALNFGGGPTYTLYYHTFCAAATTDACENYVTHIRVVYSARGWVGIGVAGPSALAMIGGHAVLGCADPSKPSVGLYSLIGQDIDQVVLVPGTLESNGIFNASFHVSTESVLEFVVVQQNVTVLNIFSSDVNGTLVKMVFAQGGENSLYFDVHAYEVSYSMDFVSNSAGTLMLYEAVDVALAAHISFALMAFGFLLPLGSFIAYSHNRTLSSDKPQWWFILHRGLQVAGSLCALASWISAISHMSYVEKAHFTLSHHILGTLVVFGVWIQVANGIFRPHLAAATADESYAPVTSKGDRDNTVSVGARSSTGPNGGAFSLILKREMSNARKTRPRTNSKDRIASLRRGDALASGENSNDASLSIPDSEHGASPGNEKWTPRSIWYVGHRIIALFVLIGGSINISLGSDVFQNVFLSHGQYYTLNGVEYNTQTCVFILTVIWILDLTVIGLGFSFGTFLRRFADGESGIDEKWFPFRFSKWSTPRESLPPGAVEFTNPHFVGGGGEE